MVSQSKQGGNLGESGFSNNRTEHANLQQLQQLADSSSQVSQLKRQSGLANGSIVQLAEDARPNDTGLPDQLKTGIENLSGYAMDDVKVHYNSDQPAKLQAHAYAQGTEIHVASGQEKHLPHEAWHVVQQKQGRVKPTRQLKEKVAVNDDAGLEKEADVMGQKALTSGMKSWDGGLETANSGGNTVQRAIENKKLDEESDHIETAKVFFDIFNAKTDAAFKFVLSVPSLGAYAALNGYMSLWLEKWNEYLSKGSAKLLAATFGYVIETLVSDSRSEFFPGHPPNYKVLPQVTVGGTRPDLVLVETKTRKHIAWIDITAANSVDHIFDKDSWDKKVSMYAEISYPSLSPSHLSFMKQNKDNIGKLDESEIKKRILEAEKAYQIQKTQWIELGKNYQKSNFSRDDLGFSKMSEDLNPGLLRSFIRQRITTNFGVEELEMKMVPSILQAMKVDSTKWGFTTGFSVSEKAGESWLIDNPLPEEIEEDVDDEIVNVDESVDESVDEEIEEVEMRIVN